jgi:hypothetical protein
VSLGEWWRERRAASDRAVAQWGAPLVVFEILAVAAGIALLSLLIEGEVSWPVVVGGTLGMGIFIWQSRRNARFERAADAPPASEPSQPPDPPNTPESPDVPGQSKPE